MTDGEIAVTHGEFTAGYAQAVQDIARILDPRGAQLYHLILSRFRP